MVLNSQAQRTGQRGVYVSRRRLKARKRIQWGAGAGAVLAVALGFYFFGPGEGEGGQGDEGQNPLLVGVDPAEAPGGGNLNPSAAPPAANTSAIDRTGHSTKLTPVTPTPTPAPTPAPTPVVNDTPAPPAPAPAAAPAVTGSATSANVAKLIESGRRLVAENKLVEARKTLTQALAGPIDPADAEAVRQQIAKMNDTLVFSKGVVDDDPLAEAYVVAAGDTLEAIGKKHHVPWQFIAKINGTDGRPIDPRRLREGMRIKVVKGPFHVVVNKRAYRLDVYAGDLYVKSFRVGLGEFDSTPVGSFIVQRGKKLQNPEWVNPRDGTRFLADDPKNPLGEFWIGLRGTDKNTELLTGYGIHGTIEPQTIGTQASMGCVRLVAADIESLYYMLLEEQSMVRIVN